MSEVMLDSRLCLAAGLKPDAVAQLWQAFQQRRRGPWT